MTKKMLLNDVRLDTQTSYFVNGDINMYACPWVEDPILVEGSKTSYRGRITVMPNGDTHVKAYREGSLGTIYKVIYQTEHCRVKLYNSGRIIEEWSFDKKLSIHDVWGIRKREAPQVNSFFLSMK